MLVCESVILQQTDFAGGRLFRLLSQNGIATRSYFFFGATSGRTSGRAFEGALGAASGIGPRCGATSGTGFFAGATSGTGRAGEISGIGRGIFSGLTSGDTSGIGRGAFSGLTSGRGRAGATSGIGLTSGATSGIGLTSGAISGIGRNSGPTSGFGLASGRISGAISG